VDLVQRTGTFASKNNNENKSKTNLSILDRDVKMTITSLTGFFSIFTDQMWFHDYFKTVSTSMVQLR